MCFIYCCMAKQTFKNVNMKLDLENLPESGWLKKAKKRKKYRLYYDLVFWIKLKYVIYLRKYF